MKKIPYEGNIVTFYKQDLINGFQKLYNNFFGEDDSLEIRDFEMKKDIDNYFWKIFVEEEPSYSFEAWLVTNNHEYYGKYPVLVKDTDGNDHYIYAEF